MNHLDIMQNITLVHYIDDKLIASDEQEVPYGRKYRNISEVCCLSEVSEGSMVRNMLSYPLQGESQIAAPYTTTLKKRGWAFGF